jgi:hypothetical protein
MENVTLVSGWILCWHPEYLHFTHKKIRKLGKFLSTRNWHPSSFENVQKPLQISDIDHVFSHLSSSMSWLALFRSFCQPSEHQILYIDDWFCCRIPMNSHWNIFGNFPLITIYKSNKAKVEITNTWQWLHVSSKSKYFERFSCFIYVIFFLLETRNRWNILQNNNFAVLSWK